MRLQAIIRDVRRAMTLLEFIGVIFLIAILVAMLIPVNPGRGRQVSKIKARVEMSDLVNAIQGYEADYGHLPLADLETNLDVTYGITPADIQNSESGEVRFNPKNSDLIIVLTDLDLGVNSGHKLNPRKIKYLNAKIVEDTNSSGVSAVDYQYRDPWGNPYVLTLDLSRDNQCCDFLYCLQKVSQLESNSPKGFNGLFNPVETNGGGNHFYFHGKVMAWSAGPDKKFDPQTSAHTGVNKDNVISWQ